MLGIGIRNNLIYPLMLLLCIFICRVDEIIMKKYFNFSLKYSFSVFLSTSQLLSALIPILYRCKKSEKKTINKVQSNHAIQYIENRQTHIEFPDSNIKITFLLFFDTFFYFVTISFRNKYFFVGNKRRSIDEFIEKRLRSMQMIFCVILCSLSTNLKIYKHQKLALLVISVFLMMNMLIEIFWLQTEILVLVLFILCFLLRSFLDTTEKYLLEVDYACPYRILLWEGIMANILFSILFIFERDYVKEIKSFITQEKTREFYILLVLFSIYLVSHGFRSLYQIHTVKYFSPMARALFELLLDPFIIIYNFWEKNKDIKDEIKNSIIYYIITVTSLLLMSFFSLVYNDFLVLYCCGLEKETYLEIKKRASSHNINFGLDDDEEDERIMDNDNTENASELSSKKIHS